MLNHWSIVGLYLVFSSLNYYSFSNSLLIGWPYFLTYYLYKYCFPMRHLFSKCKLVHHIAVTNLILDWPRNWLTDWLTCDWKLDHWTAEINKHVKRYRATVWNDGMWNASNVNILNTVFASRKWKFIKLDYEK